MTRLEYAERVILQQIEIDALRVKLKECMEIIEGNLQKVYPPNTRQGITGAYDPSFPPSVL